MGDVAKKDKLWDESRKARRSLRLCSACNGRRTTESVRSSGSVPLPVPARGAACLPEDPETLRKRVAVRLTRN